MSFTFHYRVGYYETDRMDVLHHARVFEIMERARTELLRARGRSYRQLEEAGLQLPVVRAEASYRAPIRYDDEVQVEVAVETVDRVRIVFQYAFLLAGRTAVLGRTEHVFLRQGRLYRLTPQELQQFRELLR